MESIYQVERVPHRFPCDAVLFKSNQDGDKVFKFVMPLLPSAGSNVCSLKNAPTTIVKHLSVT